MLGSLLILVSSAHAFEVVHTDDGTPLRWQAVPIAWTYDDSGIRDDVDPDAADAAVAASFDAWTVVDDAPLSFERTDTDENLVHWLSDWPYDDDLLALTSTWATSEGEILGFEVRINADFEAWGTDGRADEMDLRNAMTHEIGHGLALDHNHELHIATMYPSASYGETEKRELSADDEDGVRYLYAGLAAAAADPVDVAACSSVPRSGGALAAFTLPLILAFARRRTS